MDSQITPPGPRGGQAAGQEISKDVEHLRRLSIFHYVAGGLAAFFACGMSSHLIIGLIFVLTPQTMENGEPMPPLFGWAFLASGTVTVLGGLTVAILLIIAGRYLKRHKRRVFCLVVAGISCLMMPIGTVLGVFTIIVLSRPTVKTLFDETPR